MPVNMLSLRAHAIIRENFFSASFKQKLSISKQREMDMHGCILVSREEKFIHEQRNGHDKGLVKSAC
jgi:hypothetical protein